MGDLRPDGGATPPEDGGSHPELPNFPAEWGPVVIPDDASELDEEANALRRELRGHARRTKIRTLLGGKEAPSLGIPVVVMAVAVVTTLISLFVVTWGREASPPVPLASYTVPAQTPATTSVATTTALTDLVLLDAGGVGVRLGGLTPAVILLVDGCDCGALARQVSDAVPAGVTVVLVGITAPTVAAPRGNVRALADPDGVLRGRYGTSTTAASATPPAGATPRATAPERVTPPVGVTVILVGGAGSVPWTVSAVDSADDIPDLQSIMNRGP